MPDDEVSTFLPAAANLCTVSGGVLVPGSVLPVKASLYSLTLFTEWHCPDMIPWGLLLSIPKADHSVFAFLSRIVLPGRKFRNEICLSYFLGLLKLRALEI